MRVWLLLIRHNFETSERGVEFAEYNTKVAIRRADYFPIKDQRTFPPPFLHGKRIIDALSELTAGLLHPVPNTYTSCVSIQYGDKSLCFFFWHYTRISRKCLRRG